MGELTKRFKYREAADWSLKAYRYVEEPNAPVNERRAVWAYFVSLSISWPPGTKEIGDVRGECMGAMDCGGSGDWSSNEGIN
jgi:hypothetical protein